MYSVVQYGGMIADRIRMDAYLRALQSVVRPGSVVIDLGAGTGIFTLLACKLGAARVHAIEPNDAVTLVREAARANGCADRVVVHHGLSTALTTGERADVIVSDLHGVLPAFQGSLSTLAHAREQLLAPGGTLIPGRETLWMALVEAPELYAKHSEAWEGAPLGVTLDHARTLAVNAWSKGRVEPEQLASAPRVWAELAHAELSRERLAGSAEWADVEASRAIHGALVWFDAELVPGVVLSNAPTCPELVYGNAFFPFERPVHPAPGCRIAVSVRADPSEEDYIWSWRTEVRGSAEGDRTFEQSTFHGLPLSLDRLRRGAGSHRPALGEEGEIERAALELMNGQRTIDEIAGVLSQRFEAVREPAIARARVVKLSHRLSRSR